MRTDKLAFCDTVFSLSEAALLFGSDAVPYSIHSIHNAEVIGAVVGWGYG